MPYRNPWSFSRSNRLTRNLEKVLAEPVWEKLIGNSFHYAPPYLPIYGFMKETKRLPRRCLTRMEWSLPETKTAFREYVLIHYPEMDADQLIAKIDR